MERNIDWESRVGYNPNIDYMAIIEKHNSLVEAKDREAVNDLLAEQGGLIAMVCKAQYQKWLLTGKVITRGFKGLVADG